MVTITAAACGLGPPAPARNERVDRNEKESADSNREGLAKPRRRIANLSRKALDGTAR